MPIEAIVFDAHERWLAARTMRALRSHGVEAAVVNEGLAARVALAKDPVWLVRAGAWPFAAPSAVLASAQPSVVAIGATADSAHWRDVLAETGGDLGGAALPRIDSVVTLDPARFAASVLESGTIERATAAFARVVRVPSIDVGYQRALRVVLAVTTLHRGGAERVVLDLKRELEGAGHDVLLVLLDRPSRTTFALPPGTIELGAHPRAERIDRLQKLAGERGADVIHAHLLDGDELARLEQGRVPVVVTVHNARPGWPQRLSQSSPALTIACSRGVLADLDAAGLGARARTIWNGIEPVALTERPRRARLLVVANHRPQKRLERLPAILAAVRAHCDASLTILGEPVRAADASITDAIRAEAERHGVEVTLAPSTANVAAAYADADVVLSVSDFEGLSLVHLEALSAGVPLVTTRVAGVAELAAKHPDVRVVDDLEAFAPAILDALGTEASGLAPDFSTRLMAERHADLYQRVVAPKARGGIVLVTNNFSTGGAQSSARRLLRALAPDHRVHAIVIEEQPGHPTAGRRALEKAGIPVTVAPRAGSVDPLVTARAVAKIVDAVGPEAVLFWNVIPEHKVLIADLLLGVPVWDVSPGEMYFASFARYFGRPRVGLPYLALADYGRLLAGAIVKYEGERERAAALGTRVEVIPNGVVVPERPMRRVGPGILAGTLARISPDKQLEELIAAVRSARLPEGFELRIAGGPERGHEDYAADLRRASAGLPIRWVGERDEQELLAEIDFFAMVSEPSGCPNASLEAMAAGLAVVATKVGGAADQITPDAGILVPRGDSAALGDAIAALANDVDLRNFLGEGARARAVAHYDVRRMATNYARICLGRT